MAGPVEQTGVIIACPRCGTEVLQKSMIPVGVADSVISYACVPCARTMTMAAATAAPAGSMGSAGSAEGPSE